MSSSEQTSVDAAPRLASQPENGKPFSWDREVRRRSRHLRELLEAEAVEPSAEEPWRLKLIQRALFSTWLDERSVKHARRHQRKAA